MWLDFLLFLQNINVRDFIYVIIGFIVGFTLGFSLARHIIKKPKYTRQYIFLFSLSKFTKRYQYM